MNPKIPMLDINSPTFADDFATAIGLQHGETIEFTTPTFDRLDGRQIELPKLTLADWENLPNLSDADLIELGLGKWNTTNKGTHWLYPKEWYPIIPTGLKILIIDNTEEFFVAGETDDDYRFGLLAYGFIKP